MVKKAGKKVANKAKKDKVLNKSSRSENAARKKAVKSAIKDFKMGMNSLIKRFSEETLI